MRRFRVDFKDHDHRFIFDTKEPLPSLDMDEGYYARTEMLYDVVETTGASFPDCSKIYEFNVVEVDVNPRSGTETWMVEKTER